MLIKINVKEKSEMFMKQPYAIEFPLRGEWSVPQSPGDKIPSHGTELFGSSYAYDFVRINWNLKIHKFYHKSVLKYLLFGVSLNECYGWGESIYSPFDGIVVRINNGVNEREPVSIINDLMYQNRMNNDIRNGILNMGNIAGNYIIIRNTENIFGLFAHLKLNSILVKENEHVTAGQKIGLIGHSGNSMAPHLHFQLTDSSDYNSAKGIPCCFKTLEYYVNGVWTTKLNTIPKKKDRIRYNGIENM
jgi:hypothetical protein